MEFSRQEQWSGEPFPSPEYLSYSGVEPKSLALQADSLVSEPPGKPIVEYFGYFQFLATANKTALNDHVQTLMWMLVFISLG